MTLSSEDLQTRLPVWEALAEFWLDTELADFRLAHIARVLAASPYSWPEILAIHDFEVAPAVSANLACIAGEWAGFDRDWLCARCQHCAARRQSPWFRILIRLRRPWLRGYTAPYWPLLKLRVEQLRIQD
ncbi:DUF7079 family protein [Chitinilyticum piscinae]|uniref:DUF7079 domain-containing protein n=1 Tax=Chitinilyticum piscinae TaxID=2866724 RepID=A0A8J7FKC5_9NEIS|nr:hypothetical protein [Chitinilyticum piscinae]MBE9608204.1 hypothetical protein [Chitinilyticum piscinae]